MSAPAAFAGAPLLSACSSGADAQGYSAAAEQTWRAGSSLTIEGATLARELVRYATLAPSSHNTQCWKFAIKDKAITILPDLTRRCPAVDPDDHHLFISLGCAAENLVQSAMAYGLRAEPRFDATRAAVHITLAPTAAQASALFKALPARQSTRGDYDGTPFSNEELSLLERAGTSDGVRVLLLTDRPAIEAVLEQVVQGHTAQMGDTTFVKELKAWIRFNGAEAVRTGDGLYSAASGNPSIPTWIGELAFRWVFTPKSENDKYARQIRSSAGIAVFVGQAADKANWVEVGRCYERFALQATALGIKNAFLNQPVEVASVRPQFAAAVGLAGQRPDLVVRFGRGPALPRSLRRPVQAVLVFHIDLRQARTQAAQGSLVLQTRCGPIEYREAGTGMPLLAVHGSGGGHDQGLAFARPLACVRAPTLIFSARDDRYGTYAGAKYTASQISGAKFVGYDEGGHALVGHYDKVMSAVGALVIQAGKP